jgi:hypothetical protein
MMTHVRSFLIALFFLTLTIQGQSEGLQMQTSVGLTDPLSPDYLQKYWSYGVNFNIGFGASINRKWSFNLAFSHHTLNYCSGTIPAGNSANANQALIRLKRSAPIAHLQKVSPYFSIGAGFCLWNSPAVYREVENLPNLILPKNKLEDARHSSAPAAEVSLGIHYQLAPLSMLFAEWFTSAAFSRRQNFFCLGLRTGVLFTI